MLPHALLMVGVLAASATTTEAQAVLLHNEQVTVKFEPNDVGLCLAEVTCAKTGRTCRFRDDTPASLVVVPPDAIHDPGLTVTFTAAHGFAPAEVQVSADHTRASFRLHADLVRVEVRYELDAHAPLLRKTLVCTAAEKPAYVAGVRLWTLKPVEESLAWPKRKELGQPAVLLHDDAGCLLTLEWPRSEVIAQDGEVSLGYRPGYRLAAGESREVAAGSLLCFRRTHEKDALEASRRAFFDHMRARVQPKTPCPIKFTTWGPWLKEANADRVLEIMDDLAYVGTDLFHFDAGWQWPDHPYSQRLPGVLDADNETFDRAMTQPERLPDGLLPLVKAAKARGMALSLWFDALGCVFVREGDEWAIRDRKGAPVQQGMWEGRWKSAPVQTPASEYGHRLRQFVAEAQKRYALGGVMFDNDNYRPDYAKDHDCLANGWDSQDVQLRHIIDILDECDRRQPGIYRFFCHGASWPWILLHATHLHAGDPGTSDKMREAVATDCPARALAYERRMAWAAHYERFVPPWGVKGDIAGWSLQQLSPIPVNLAHTDQLIAAGEGWTQNLFTCFATTCVRDIRFSFRQMPAFDRDILKEWLAWGQRRAQFIFNCRPLGELPRDPNSGIVGISQVGEGRGVIYLFNCSFDAARAEVSLDERAGFRPADVKVPAYIAYPMKARVPGETLSYGQVLRLPLAPKDCAVIEVGLEQPEKPATYAEYERTVATIRRSFDTLFRAPVSDVVAAVKSSPVRVEVGGSKADRRLAATIVETLGAGVGRRLTLDECLAVSPEAAGVDLIIGTHDGLADHARVGRFFEGTLYSRFVRWDGLLISAPLVARVPGVARPTFVLIAPRPEQLARLAINLSTAISRGARVSDAVEGEPRWSEHSMTVAVPPGRAVLRFRPLMKLAGAVTMPGDLDLVHYEIQAEVDGTRTRLWQEDIPPFFSRTGDAGWWGDRIVSLAGLDGRKVTLRFSAAHKDGRDTEPCARGGYDHIALLQIEPAASRPDRHAANIRLSDWERGVKFESTDDPSMAMYVWFYEWNLFEAVQPGEHTHNEFQRFTHTFNADGSKAEIRADDIVLTAVSVRDGADLQLTVTNRSDHDWPDVAGIIPCFNPGPPETRNPQFTNTKTYFVGPDGLARQDKREIHFNADLLQDIEARSDHGVFVFSGKWPTSPINATDGLLLRESEDGQWVAGIAWERYLSAQGHNPWDCMHLGVRVGPLKRGDTRTIRGKVYLSKGDRDDCLRRYRADFGH